MKHMYKFISLFSILLLTQCQPSKLQRYVFQKDLMYTTFDIVLYSSTPRKKLENHIENIWKHLETLEFELSPAKQGSVGNLNIKKQFSKQKNPQIFSILSNFIIESKIVNKESDGSFDLTVYPLIRLWKFYIQDEQKVLPQHEDIIKTLESVGMKHVHLNEDQITLKQNVQLDLGAIAKGFAVDEAIKILKQHTNIHAGFVNAGGNIRVYGTKPDGTPWRVGIRNPNGDQQIKEVVSLYDGDSIATSGDYEQYFEYDGKYYHHIFNPKTGYPVTHNLASVSVVLNGDAQLADILATTFLALGKDKTLQLVSKYDKYKDLSLYFIERKQTELTATPNKLWKKRR